LRISFLYSGFRFSWKNGSRLQVETNLKQEGENHQGSISILHFLAPIRGTVPNLGQSEMSNSHKKAPPLVGLPISSIFKPVLNCGGDHPLKSISPGHLKWAPKQPLNSPCTWQHHINPHGPESEKHSACQGHWSGVHPDLGHIPRPFPVHLGFLSPLCAEG